ncbi:hypothetical protein RCL_jg24341.t1 [Rhizophagus clarus]|uniref:Uncharacterized protein n=1 Tax=Rhizophagus clarus TaxID=94130 RepID=A0A8H3MHL4_9GLOM|nr:hypothetical protein RCL_jg24341.t1 [Rhizophagus clarus]
MSKLKISDGEGLIVVILNELGEVSIGCDDGRSDCGTYDVIGGLDFEIEACFHYTWADNYYLLEMLENIIIVHRKVRINDNNIWRLFLFRLNNSSR